MHTTTGDDFLINNSKSQRYVITFVVSAMLLFLLLLIPLKITVEHFAEQRINLILSKSVVVNQKQTKKKRLTIQSAHKLSQKRKASL